MIDFKLGDAGELDQLATLDDDNAKPSRHYLGDAVYVEADQCRGWVLTTSDGYRDTATIVLEPETVAAFLHHILKPEAWQALKDADRASVVGDGG